MLVGQKWRIARSVVIAEVQRRCGVNLLDIASESEIATAMTELEILRHQGMPNEHSDN